MGFVSAAKMRPTWRLMIATDGPANSGKTEFALSAPGPGLAVCLDRGYEAMLANQHPPATRNPNWAFNVVRVPLAGTQDKEGYVAYWTKYRDLVYACCANPDARTILIDGDSDSWELQRLAVFGKLQQIPPILYTQVNAARRAYLARLFDSGKIIIATNKVKRAYFDKLDRAGNPMLDSSGKPISEWDQKTYTRQGFNDDSYLWQVHLRHMYRVGKEGPEWGLRILECKNDREMDGYELWGEDCNFAGLVQTILPNVSLKEWGF